MNIYTDKLMSAYMAVLEAERAEKEQPEQSPELLECYAILKRMILRKLEIRPNHIEKTLPPDSI